MPKVQTRPVSAGAGLHQEDAGAISASSKQVGCILDGVSFLSLLEDALLEANCGPLAISHSKPNGNEGQGVSALQLGPQREVEKKHMGLGGQGSGRQGPRPTGRI